jgi:SulP family sulfate permease
MKINTGNLFGGVTAAVVALPLALAFGVASGMGPAAGLYGAIFGGLFVAFFGGTPTQITGPTGPMTVVMAGILTLLVGRHPENGVELALTTVMLGGFIQMLLGYFKLGRFINLVPYTVISGFMTGIGLIIILLQIPIFLGSPIEVISPAQFIVKSVDIFNSYSINAVMLGVPLLLLISIWPAKLNKWFPSPLLILIVGTISSLVLFDTDDFSRLAAIPSGLPTLHFPTFDLSEIMVMLKYAFVLALLGSIDSLLTSLVADSMTRTEHDSNKEMIGQGIGNMAAGFFGGIPGAGATMRTVVNIRSGGNSHFSALVHSVVLILLGILGGALVVKIPQMVLAVILLKVGFDIIDWKFLTRLAHAPNTSISITVSVILLTVFDDLITAVAVGIILASIYTVNRLSNEQLSSVKLIHGDQLDEYLEGEDKSYLADHLDEIQVFSLSGPFSFGAAKDLSKKLTAVHDFKILIIDVSAVPSLDTSMALAIEEIISSNRKFGRIVVLVSPNEQVNKILVRLKVIQLLGAHKLVDNRHEAVLVAKKVLDSRTEKS